jgi:signal transduction histidine kinase
VPAVPAPQTSHVGGAGAQDRNAWTSRVVVPALLVAYVAVLYASTVLAGRALVGASPGARFGLTVLAAAVAALTLEPVGAWLRRRLPVLPQDRLARLARGAQAATDLNEVLASTTRLLQEGLGAASVEIQRGPRPAGNDSAHVTVIPLERSRTTLGALRVTMPPGTQLSPRDQALLSGVAQHLATILQTAALREALRTTIAEAELRTADLRLSRQRIVLTSHRGRRQVERDIHDGAQQHLVALAVHLGLLRSLVADRPSGSPPVETARSSARAALAALDELSSGLYPARLAEHGLAVALEQAALSSPLPVAVDARDLPRADPDVEAAVYFCCLEAMQNAAKHAQASRVDLCLASRGGAVTFAVTDDGRGFLASATPAGAGTHNMRDRLESLGGALRVSSAPGAGTTVSGKVPAAPRPAHPGVPAPRSGWPRRAAEG